MIKIVGGLYRGRKLKSVKKDVRPSTAYAKKRFFDIIGEKIIGSTFLDAFSGTGAVGIEAIGRGADLVVFLDSGKESLKVIKHNIEKLEIPEDKFLIIPKDYNMGVKEAEKRGFKFDIVYIDPPFVYYKTNNPLRILYKRDVLAEDFIIALERPKEYPFNPKYFKVWREFKTSSSFMSFYKEKEKL